MAGANGSHWLTVPWEETIPLPPGSTIVSLPGRWAIGLDPASGQFERVERVEGIGPVLAAAAILPPAYLRTLLPAFLQSSSSSSSSSTLPLSRRSEGSITRTRTRTRTSATLETEDPLPLLGYTAIGWAEDGFRVAARRLDRRRCWDPVHFGTPELPARIAAKRRAFPSNRIVEQLARCSLEYHCYTAQNFFYGRWEAGIPVSKRCNARCRGCISLQPSRSCRSPQERIAAEPTAAEIVEVAAEHLSNAKDPMVSFGQGCEGEPLMQAERIAEAVRRVRSATPRGTVHLNTNGSRPEVVEDLAEAGVQSFRVSLASANPTRYDGYHAPRGYNLWDVGEFIDRAKRRGLRVALNVLTFPGVTDMESEIQYLLGFLRGHPVDAVQLRNLNLDPAVGLAVLAPGEPGIGVRQFLARLRAGLPAIPVESFNRARRGR